MSQVHALRRIFAFGQYRPALSTTSSVSRSVFFPHPLRRPFSAPSQSPAPPKRSLDSLLKSLKKPTAKAPTPPVPNGASPPPPSTSSTPNAPSSALSEMMSLSSGLKIPSQPAAPPPPPMPSVLDSLFKKTEADLKAKSAQIEQKANETKKQVENNMKVQAEQALLASQARSAAPQIEDSLSWAKPVDRKTRQDQYYRRAQELEAAAASGEDGEEEFDDPELIGSTDALMGDRDESAAIDGYAFGDGLDFIADAAQAAFSGPSMQKGASAVLTTRCTIRDMAKQLGLDDQKALDIFLALDSTIDSLDTEVTPDLAALFNTEMEKLNYVIMIPGERDATAAMTEEQKAATYATFPTRPSVICVMGHVDHGKTTLLDSLRNSNMAKNEHGGITQAMGAFLIKAPDDLGRVHTLTFLDTPGHAAFKSMRQRGANLTDIIVLVVGADDGVQPQTREVIKLAQETSTPVVVALNKMDSPNRDPERVRTQLLQCGLDIQNDVAVVEISGLKKMGLEKLVQEVSFLAEVMDLRAPDQGPAEAVIVELRMDRKSGPVLHTIVTWGRLRVNDHFVVGHARGKVKRLVDHNGDDVENIEPGFPAHVYGLEQIDESTISQDSDLIVVESEDRARDVIEFRKQRDVFSENSDHQRDVESRRFRMKMEKSTLPKKLFGRKRKALTTQEVQQLSVAANAEAQGADDETKPNFSVVFKADNKGSLEAIIDYFQLLPPSDEVSFNMVATGVGTPNPQDIEMARLSKAPMVLFNMKLPDETMTLIRHAGVDVKEFKIIYQLFDFVRDSIAAKLPSSSQLVVTARLEYKKKIELNFKDKRLANGLGCKVVSGLLLKTHKLRVVRDGKVIAENVDIRSLRHVKDAVDQVTEGKECCLTIDLDPSMVETGDHLEALELKKIPRTYDDTAARGFVDHRAAPFKHQHHYQT